MHCRRILVFVLVLILLLSACGPVSTVSGAPGSVSALPAAAEPDRAINHESFTVALLSSAGMENHGGYLGFLQRLQNLLWAKGWKVTLQDLPYTVSDDQSWDKGILDAIGKQAASGQAPDAWHVPTDIAKRLRAKGLTRDMAAIMPTASAMLWDLCKGDFAHGADGVPIRLTTRTKGKPLGLTISAAELQAYGAPIASTDDVLTFLEKQPDATILSVGGLNQLLMEVWAAQHGYYPLSDYGLPLFFYARIDDEDCTPVPIEDIEGFDLFFRRWTALWLKGRLGDGTSGLGDFSGVLGSLSGFYPNEMQRALGLQGEDVVALPLAGCTRLPPADPPICYDMLAVPAASQQASVVAAFAQWALLDRQGYDLCTLGQRDVDYHLEGERVEYLDAGQPLPNDWDFDPKNTAFFQYSYVLVSFSDKIRVTKGSADNLEQVLAQCKAEVPPIWRVKALRWHDFGDVFAATREPYADVVNQHMDDVSYSVGLINGVPVQTADEVLQRLCNNRAKLDPLILALKKRLRQLLDDPDGDPTQSETKAP